MAELDQHGGIPAEVVQSLTDLHGWEWGLRVIRKGRRDEVSADGLVRGRAQG